MNPYENCLRAIERLLSATGVTYWPESIQRDIRDWQDFRDTSHHLSTYGGMGSFNDVVISQLNSNNVTDEQDPWVNSLFSWLKAVAYYLAKHPTDHVSVQELQENVGCYDSVFVAFVGWNNVRSDARGRTTDRKVTLDGWFCIMCHHYGVTRGDLVRYIITTLVPKLVFQACENEILPELVDTD